RHALEVGEDEDGALLLVEPGQELMEGDRGLAAGIGLVGRAGVGIGERLLTSGLALPIAPDALGDAVGDREQPGAHAGAMLEFAQASSDDEEDVVNGIGDRRLRDPEALEAAPHEGVILAIDRFERREHFGGGHPPWFRETGQTITAIFDRPSWASGPRSRG